MELLAALVLIVLAVLLARALNVDPWLAIAVALLAVVSYILITGKEPF